MFNPNFIEIYDNALSSYNCKEIIKWVENQSLIRGVCLGVNNTKVVDTKSKSDWEVHYSKTTFTNKTFVDLIIADVLVKYTPLYRESYPCVDNIDPWNGLSEFDKELIQWSDSQFFGQTEFQNKFFVVNSQVTPWRQMRQAIMEIQTRLNALQKVTVQYKRTLNDIKRCEYEREQE